jgi:hypothetical protein
MKKTEPSMSRLSIIVLAAAALPLLATTPSRAQYAAQLYPYCSLSSSTGATNCYISSRAQCGRSSCISNPWYIGAERARPYLEGRKALVPRYEKP